MSISEDGLQVSMGRAEALVLFEMLADFHTQQCLQVESSAERLALVRLHGALEKALIEPFLPEYQTLIAEARSNLSAQFGS